MTKTRLFLLILILATAGWELFALFTPGVESISEVFWDIGYDRQIHGAPVAALLGFYLIHLIYPRRRRTRHATLWGIGIAAWTVYELVALFWLPAWPWTTSRMAYRWFSQIGIPVVDVLIAHMVAGHFLFPRLEKDT